jgi:hypothetical protein
MEQGLSSNAVFAVRHFGWVFALALSATALSAQDDGAVSDPPVAGNDVPPVRIDLTVRKPRGEINQAQVRACEDQAEAGKISGEIVVCRQLGEDPDNLYSSRDEARKRYAEETAFSDAPPPPNVFGIGDLPFKVGFGSAPPPALMIDVGDLPAAPAGSDADRIARGLPPLGQDTELTEEQEKARREALGIRPAPALIRPPGKPKKSR